MKTCRGGVWCPCGVEQDEIAAQERAAKEASDG